MGGAREPRLVQLLRTRAETTPNRVAYEVVDGEGAVSRLTYAELAARATGLARSLLARPGADGPALVLYAPGLDYVVALFACLAARVPAVPAYPPDPWRPGIGLARLARLIEDARPTSVLGDPLLTPMLDFAGAPQELASAVVSHGDGAELPTAWQGDGMDVAVVQYTSGSTRAPRGVVVRHRNLEANIPAIVDSFRLTEESRGFVWLPPYHDMGLVGGILTPMWLGFPVRLMSPLDFLKRPLSWLRQISETRATASGGPNFAYELCVRRRFPAEDVEALDLSSWSVAFNGAEPVRRRTMQDFADAFGPAGFRRSAFYPCYGLAEATLIVSGRHWDGTTVGGADGEPPRVSCGPPIADHRVAVVDAATLEAVPEGGEGEIWVHGPSVATGYWSAGREDEAFGELAGVSFLRTGDLGRLVGGEVLVTGRLKDVIVLRGVNYHAADVEDAAVSDAPALRRLAAAFALEDGDETLAVLVVEARPAAREPADVAASVRTRVLEATGLALHVVVVAPPGTIPRTSSGKVQRGVCRERFRAGELPGVAVPVDSAGAALLGAAAAAADGEAPEELLEFVRGVFAAACGVPGCEPDETLFDLGGDSVRAAEIAGVLESALDVPLPVDAVLEALTPEAVAGRIAVLWSARHGDADALGDRLQDLAAETSPVRA